MKFDCGETDREKRARLCKWHRWFAWRPVKVANHDCRWLEYVERRMSYTFLTFDILVKKEYRSV